MIEFYRNEIERLAALPGEGGKIETTQTLAGHYRELLARVVAQSERDSMRLAFETIFQVAADVYRRDKQNKATAKVFATILDCAAIANAANRDLHLPICEHDYFRDEQHQCYQCRNCPASTNDVEPWQIRSR